MVSGNFTLNLWFTFLGPGHSICWAQVDTTLGFPSGSKNWPFKRFSTTMLRAMGQQKRSKRTTSNSIDRFWNQICPIFPSWGLYRKKNVFFKFLGLIWRGTQYVLQKVVHACVAIKCSACVTKVIQKLGHYASNLCFVGERNSEHEFLQLKWKLD